MKRTNKIILTASLVVMLTLAMSTTFARGNRNSRHTSNNTDSTGSYTISNTNNGQIVNDFLGTSTTGGNRADNNGLNGSVSSGAAAAGVTASNELNSNDISIDLTGTTNRRTTANISNSNTGSVQNITDYLADAGGNSASGNGGANVTESSSLNVNATVNADSGSSTSSYSSNTSDCCQTGQQGPGCDRNRRHQQEECCTSSSVDKAEANEASSFSASLDLAKTHERSSTQVGSGIVSTGSADVTTNVTTVLNSSVVRIVR